MNRARGSDLPRVTNARRHAATLAHAPKTDVSSAGSLPDPLRHANSGWHAGAAVRLLCEPLEPRTLLAADPLTSLTAGNEQVSLIGDPDPDLAGAAAAHKITLARGGYLDISLAPPTGGIPGDRQLQLRDVAGTLVATSVEGPKGVKLSQYLPEGTYGLSLAAPRGAMGTCSIVRTVAEPPGPLTLGAFPGDARPAHVTIGPVGRGGRGPVGVFVVDSNSNQPSVVVYLDLPDGEGRPSGRFRRTFEHPVADGRSLDATAIGDVDGDDRPDIVVATGDAITDTTNVTMFAGDGAGRFDAGLTLMIEGIAGTMHIADIDRDGRPDLVLSVTTADSSSGSLVILWGAEGGFTTTASLRTPVNGIPAEIAIGDFDGNGCPDLAAAFGADSAAAGRIDLWPGLIDPRDRGRGLESPTSVSLATAPYRLAVADLDHDGCDDIVAACQRSNPATGLPSGGTVTVLQGSARGARPAATELEMPAAPHHLAVGDLDADGRLDVVVALDTDSVGILRGDGRGGIAWADDYRVGAQPHAVALADIDGDGRLDIATADHLSGTVTILEQRPDGSYPRRPSNTGDAAVTLADVNGDGRIDAVTRVPERNAVSILVGRGDGTFASGGLYEVGTDADVGDMPIVVAVADVNGDGRPDIVSANAAPRSLTVLLGVGDGSFGTSKDGSFVTRLDLSLDDQPSAVVVQDVDGDGSSDIVVTTGVQKVGAVTVLYGGKGRLSFAERATRPVGFSPVSVMVADIDGDGRRDLVVANAGDSVHAAGTLSVLGATGRRAFSTARDFGTDGRVFGGGPGENGGTMPTIVGAAAADFDADGRAEVALTMNNSVGNFLVILDDFGARGFGSRREIPLGVFPSAPVTGDVDGDGRPDIAVSLLPERGSLGSVCVYRGGSLDAPPTIAEVLFPLQPTIADLDSDGRGDVVAVDGRSRLAVLVSQPDGSLAEVGPGTFADRRTNRVVPLAPQAGMPDGSVTLDRSGTILVRRGGGAGPVEAAGVTAFDVAVVRSGDGPATIAAIDDDRRGISLFTLASDGSLGPRRRFEMPRSGGRGAILSRIRGADVDGDGNDDLVVSDPGTASIRVLLAGRAGDFSRSVWTEFAAAAGVSEFVLADVNGDRRPDLIAAAQVSGHVSVRLGLPAAAEGSGGPVFRPERRFRTTARTATFAPDRFSGRGTPVATERIDDVAAGDFDGDGLLDIATTSAANQSIAMLAGLPGGGFAAPRIHHPRAVAAPGPLLVTRAAEPRNLAAGDFNGDGRADIAILDRANEQVLLYLSGSGAAADPSALPTTVIPLAGNAVTSLIATRRDGPGGRRDGVFDLLVGNESGDVLLLRGESDSRGVATGRFAPAARAETGVALIATDIDGDGRTDFVYGSRSLDSVAVNTAANVEIFRADLRQGLVGPSAVTTVAERVGGTAVRNLLVLNGAGNELLVFRGNPDSGAPFLAPQRFFVGTHPTALATADFNGDGIVDVAVANGGSSDLSILLGDRGGDGRWTLVRGPRLQLGGSRPAAIAVGDFVNAAGAAAADGIPDIAVTAPGRDAVTIIPGVGRGFFADNSLRQLALPVASSPAAVFAMPRGLGLSSSLVVVNSGTSSISTFDAGRGFTRADISSGGLAPRSAAAYSQGGTTALAVANAGTGNVSVFLASPGSLLSAGGSGFAAVASSPNANASSLAFDSTGRLFGFAGGEAPPLALYAFNGSASSAAVSTDALRALINFLPSQASAVGLVATLVTSAGISLTDATSRGSTGAGRNAAPGDGNTESLGGDGEPTEPVADESTPGRGDVAETELAPILRFFLDLEANLEETNDRLLETLLSRVGDDLAATLLARARVRRTESAHPEPQSAAAGGPPRDSARRTRGGEDERTAGNHPDSHPEGRPVTDGLFAAFDPRLPESWRSVPRSTPHDRIRQPAPAWPEILLATPVRVAPAGFADGASDRHAPGSPRGASGRLRPAAGQRDPQGHPGVSAPMPEAAGDPIAIVFGLLNSVMSGSPREP